MLGSNTDGELVFEPNAYNLVIAGFQFTPLKNINVAIDYQGKMYDDSSKDNVNLMYVHFQYIF
jgi:hypothetical protein